MIDTTFCALVGQLFLTKLNHYFNITNNTNMFCAIQSDTKLIRDTAPLLSVTN